MLLGIGGAKLIDELNFNPDLYHLNEAHGISAAFYLLHKYKSVGEVEKASCIYNTYT